MALTSQGSVPPSAVTVTASVATNVGIPAVEITTNSGVIYQPNGTQVAVTGYGIQDYATWNGQAVAFPPAPGSGTTYRHFGANIVWSVLKNQLVIQEYGPMDTTSSSSPWTVANSGKDAYADGNIIILQSADCYLATASGGGQSGGSGNSGSSCPIEGTEIVPLGSPAFARPFENREWVKITLADGKSLTATPRHPVYTDRGKTPLDELREGEEVVTRDGMVRVEKIERLNFEAKAQRIEMQTGHLYWANGILSHNWKIL